MLMSIMLFAIAGFAEISGGYLIWLWLRESKPISYGIIGSILVMYHEY